MKCNFTYAVAALVLLLSTATRSAELPNMIETPEQLLAAVNGRMKAMNHSPFTLDELTVWLASQAGLNRPQSKLPPRVETFLSCLAAKKKFEDPVSYWLVPGSDMRVAGDDHAKNSIPLPDYYRFEIVIYNVVPGSTDSEGNHLKATRDSIVVATALGTPE